MMPSQPFSCFCCRRWWARLRWRPSSLPKSARLMPSSSCSRRRSRRICIDGSSIPKPQIAACSRSHACTAVGVAILGVALAIASGKRRGRVANFLYPVDGEFLRADPCRTVRSARIDARSRNVDRMRHRGRGRDAVHDRRSRHRWTHSRRSWRGCRPARIRHRLFLSDDLLWLNTDSMT